MTSLPDSKMPPGAAAWVVGLFASGEKGGLILGDLSEEYSRLAMERGRAVARRWFWRQALWSRPHLFLSAFREAPWSITSAILAGFFLRRLLARLPGFVTFVLLDRWGIYPHHSALGPFLTSTAIDLEHVLIFVLVGGVVASIARKREIVPAAILGAIYFAMALVGSIWGAIRTEDYALLWRLSWYFTDSLAIVLGAWIVRSRRPGGDGQPVQP
jgi:hypothetical protein